VSLTVERVNELLSACEQAAYADAAYEWSDKVDSDGTRLLRGWNDEAVRKAGYENPDGVYLPDGVSRYACMAASGRVREAGAAEIAELCRRWLGLPVAMSGERDV
jgi:hypothetical protein